MLWFCSVQALNQHFLLFTQTLSYLMLRLGSLNMELDSKK